MRTELLNGLRNIILTDIYCCQAGCSHGAVRKLSHASFCRGQLLTSSPN
jgi:hypothetical protein